jgi:hypothetical protein
MAIPLSQREGKVFPPGWFPHVFFGNGRLEIPGCPDSVNITGMLSGQ